jgi:DMSO/TMAO reductase YedYZ molybdopterin-dependent catalytic subunit
VCSSDLAATPVPPTPTLVAQPLLTIVGTVETKTLTLDDLKALPVTEGEAGFKSSTGKITLPLPHRGVALKDLAELVGPLDPGNGVTVVAEDGYAMTYSYDQLTKGAFVAYDPATGDELKTPPSLTVILAYEREGQPLPKDSDGALRVVIVSPERTQVTDGHWNTKWVNKIEVKPLVADWNLALKGGIDVTIDRATFESCAQCHKASWTDDKAQEWTGVALWRLLGYVDDAVKHEGKAINEELAKAGYQVVVTASDGYQATFDSANLSRNDEILVAYLVNGNPLPEKYFPLRLVGAPLRKSELVGAITGITLDLGQAAAQPAESPTPTPAPAAPAAEAAGGLAVTGAVEKALQLAEADLRALEVVHITAEHPKKGAQEYDGVRLSTLLAQAKPSAGASAIVFTAGDGYAAEAELAAVQACADCLGAFTDTPGQFALAMPGLPSNLWVKGIAKIEVK